MENSANPWFRIVATSISWGLQSTEDCEKLGTESLLSLKRALEELGKELESLRTIQ